jgi:CRP/FNR family transcriptional regulator, anaerobic regulatory protein
MYELLEQYFQDKIDFSKDQFEQVKSLFKPKTTQRREILLRSGDVCRQSYFVCSGCLRSYVIDKKGKEFVIQFAPKNWWISDLNSFFSQEPSMFFIDAIEPSEILVGERGYLQKLEAIHPGYASLFNKLIRNSHRSLQKRLVNHLIGTAEDRYLDFLNTYPDLARRVPQQMIASYIGVMPESLSRIRKELAKSK